MYHSLHACIYIHIHYTHKLSLAGVATSVIFDTTKVLSQQARLCHDKKCVLSRQKVCRDKTCVCRDTKMFVATSTRVCRNKRFVATNMSCRDKHVFRHDKHIFVMTKPCLSQQNFCCDPNPTCGSSRQ